MLRIRLPRTVRYLLGALGLVAVVTSLTIGYASRRFYTHQRAAYIAQAATLHLPAFKPPTAATRLLVFAPHCDDDILGCAGLIQQTLKAGGKVRVITLTNGDGYRTGVQRQEHRLRLESKDYIRFAYRRQEESVKALTSLGVDKKEIFFLGYPDRGLLPMWNDYWKPNHPYTSTFTRVQSSPYKNAKTPNTPYCGEAVLADVRKALQEYQPTLITVTHPEDDHPDHAASSAFVTLAYERSFPDHAEAHLYYYLVHRGNWPPPSNKPEGADLNPPLEMSHLGTYWQSLPLTEPQRQAKEQAIRAHATQIALTKSFLLAFACRNELFDYIPIEVLIASAEPTILVAQNPISDSFPRAKLGEGDIQSLRLGADRQCTTATVVVQLREKASSRIDYRVRLRVFGEVTRDLLLRTHDSQALKRQGIRVSFEDKEIHFTIPFSLLSTLNKVPSNLYVLSADTSLAGVEIDKTGIRFVINGGIM